MKLHIFLAGLLCFVGAGFAQEASPPQHVEFYSSNSGPGEQMMINIGPANGEVFFFEHADQKMVKGAPYTATASTETTQVLADGNRIVHKQSGLIARDSEGRTRREEVMAGMGPVQVNAPKVIFIHDPVAGAAYILEPEKQTARAMKHDMSGTNMEQMHRKMQQAFAANGEQGDVKTESLGTQQIEGVSAEGTRITRTIPAGKIGNEQPIQITVETWTSPDLHTTVLQKRNDPRFGETVFQLTNIKQGEPDASLFQLPSGYKTEQMPAMGDMKHMMLMRKPMTQLQ
ncbi:MAG TPA: hypothetical protein VFR08_07795 [Candidatus Angelobacter sp.]|nr:hypothetical protein [Candidatus Angelobacter sp.]